MAASDPVGCDLRVGGVGFDYSGLTALVTGATSGIGFAVAHALEVGGAVVRRHGVETDQASDVLVHDLSRAGAGRELAAAVLSLGQVDILVHCASIQQRAEWPDIAEGCFQSQLQTNLISSFDLIQQLIRPMRERRWGRVLTIGSVQQARPHPRMLAYAASKSAMLSVVRNLAKQLAPFGVTVNNLAPGVVETPRNSVALSDDEYRRNVVRGIPAGRVGTVADCVTPALLFCSREAGYITGQDLYVDGGMSL
jgi:NAD(P)-dependent dehydrogenase (short-subunit alcohol dehydrogenase family)